MGGPAPEGKGGGTGRGVLEAGEGGGGGVGCDPPSSQGSPMVPAEGGPTMLKLQSSWHRRRRSKILAVSLKHWKGRRGGGVQGGGGTPTPPAVYGPLNTSLGTGPCSKRLYTRLGKRQAGAQCSPQSPTPWTVPPERATPPPPNPREDQSPNAPPPLRGTVPEDPPRTFPLQLHRDHRKHFLRRRGLLGQVTPPEEACASARAHKRRSAQAQEDSGSSVA